MALVEFFRLALAGPGEFAGTFALLLVLFIGVSLVIRSLGSIHLIEAHEHKWTVMYNGREMDADEFVKLQQHLTAAARENMES